MAIFYPIKEFVKKQKHKFNKTSRRKIGENLCYLGLVRVLTYDNNSTIHKRKKMINWTSLKCKYFVLQKTP